jgi:hypothetical protein
LSLSGLPVSDLSIRISRTLRSPHLF